MNKQEAIDKVKQTLNDLKEIALSLKGKKEVKLEDIKAEDGTLIITDGDLVVGVGVTTKDAEGNIIPLNDGVYKYNGNNLTITEGKVVAIEEIPDEETSPEEDANVNMEKVEVKAGANPADYKSVKRVDDWNTFYFDGDLAQGVEIFRIDCDGAKSPLYKGDFLLEDGTKITVEINDEGKSVVSAIGKSGSENPEPEATLEDVTKDTEVEDEITEEVVASSSTEQRLTNMENAFNKTLELLNEVLGKSKEISEEKSKLEKEVQELSAQPGDDTVEEKLKKSKIELSETEARIRRMKEMANAL